MSALEAKTRFGELLNRVERGEEIVITRHGRPIARVVREGAPSLDSVKQSRKCHHDRVHALGVRECGGQ